MQSGIDKKAALKALRKERRTSIKRATMAMQAQRKALKAIEEAFAKGAATVPEIAQRTRIPTDRVLYFLATMKKYGRILEAGKDGGYYRYVMAPAKA